MDKIWNKTCKLFRNQRIAPVNASAELANDNSTRGTAKELGISAVTILHLQPSFPTLQHARRVYTCWFIPSKSSTKTQRLKVDKANFCTP